MVARHLKSGRFGEEMARIFLAKQGYEVLELNWRCRYGELDLICRDQQAVIFVEVKTRGSTFFGRPEEFVKRQKQKFIIRAANAYIEKHDLDMEARFDVIGVIVNPRGKEINHIEDAFSPLI